MVDGRGEKSSFLFNGLTSWSYGGSAGSPGSMKMSSSCSFLIGVISLADTNQGTLVFISIWLRSMF
ncbi:hypothetical protein DPMN_104704 [Dreissena polymorpha]|uniref:Uncharacterized protein n=1 Tax=Dreissena polymorpha TaxID=45954 RepID=A0A9D4HFZ1_DREPO|nr:hypothetical protein DPMN_104704 [Dreissena polymorpha]